jgi:hypothetical protein
MDAFEKQLMERSPLAACVLEISDFIFDQKLLDSVWESNRGRCYTDVLRFEDFLHLMRDALIHHGGSAHQLFVEMERGGSPPVDESNFYRKLARMPVAVSRGLLREGTAKLEQLLPEGMSAVRLADCFGAYEVIAADGKKIKNATKRLKPTRGYSGKLIGAKALVGMNLRSGMAVAMSDSQDGLTNDVPLVEALMQQLHQIIPRPILSIWDRQFDDLRTLRRISIRRGDGFIVRMRQNHTFCPESSLQRRDDQGRRVSDEIGLLGKGKDRMRVRRITLHRSEQAGGEQEDVALLTNLMDPDQFPAAEVLGLYRRRWGIEQMFQQVTETFSLVHLIGSSPRAVLLQFAYCLLLYNLVQLIKLYVAQDGGVMASVVSTFYLFNDIRRELMAWAYHSSGAWPRQGRNAMQMRRRLEQLLEGSWDPVAYTKASDKKPRPKRPPPIRLYGGHSSVQRVLEGRAKIC